MPRHRVDGCACRRTSCRTDRPSSSKLAFSQSCRAREAELMADRREDEPNHTDRPNGPGERGGDAGLPTVREILTLEAVAQDVPEVLAGDDALDARVRWVHASDSAGVARLLNGGELLLSTGSGWPTEPADLEVFIAG